MHYETQQKEAAVECLFRQCGVDLYATGRAKVAAVTESAALKDLARQMGIGVAELQGWCYDLKLRGRRGYAGENATEEEMETEVRTRRMDAAAAEHVERYGSGSGAIPSPMETFEAMLAREGVTVSREEREALVKALEGGKLSPQRRARAAALIGATLSPGEVIFRFLGWLWGDVPMERVWKVRDTTRRLDRGDSYVEAPEALPAMSKWPKLSRARLEIRRADGGVEVLDRARPWGRPKAGVLRIAILEPVEAVATRAQQIKMAMLFQWMQGGGAQKDFARMFGLRKQTINEHAQALDAKMQEAGGFRFGRVQRKRRAAV